MSLEQPGWVRSSQDQSRSVGIGWISRDESGTVMIRQKQSGWVGNSQDQSRSGGRVGSVRIISLDVLRCLIYAVIFFFF